MKPDHNILNLDQKSKLWLPILIFTNTKKKMKATFNDVDAIGKIKRKDTAKFTLTNLQTVQRDRIYKGEDG